MELATTLDARQDLTRGICRSMVQGFLAQVDAESPRTTSAYRGAISRLFDYLENTEGVTCGQLGDMVMVKPTPETLRNWKQHMKETLRPRSANLYLTAARLFFNWLQDSGKYHNVMHGIKGLKTPRTHSKENLTEEQAVVVLGNVAKLRDKAMMMLMFTTGIRCVSVSRANVGDFRNQGNQTIIRVWDKGHVAPDRISPVPARTAALVNQYLATRGGKLADDAPLFVTEGNRSSNQRLTPKAIGRIATDAIRAAGISTSRITAHSLRHTTATIGWEKTRDSMMLQTQMGHASFTTTQNYIRPADEASNLIPQLVEDAILGVTNDQNL